MRRLHQDLSCVFLLGAVALGAFAGEARATTGTFLDRWDESDLRIASYNVYFNSWLSPSRSADAESPDRFRRLVTAIDPDVLALQEMSGWMGPAAAALLDELLPLPGEDRWQSHQVSDNVILSRYPLISTGGSYGHADVYVDLPDDRFDSDLYVINDHWPCCDNEAGRQDEADALVDWIDGLKQPGSGLAADTPMVVLGDLNTVRSMQPLRTLLTGDVIGPSHTDAPPDWDDTPLTSAAPLHNGVGPERYTWRNDSDVFDPGVLDHVIYTDSVLETANRLVLNTAAMSPAELAATGLQADDVILNTRAGFYDHLPLVVDFRERPFALPGDYDRDGQVDTADYAVWRSQYGGESAPPADGNGDGVVNAADYTVWRDAYGASPIPAAVPEPAGLALAIAGVALTGPRRPRRG